MSPESALKTVPTWPRTPRMAEPDMPVPGSWPAVPADALFPSGRQALVAAVSLAGLGRSARVAVPEWSSNCVISAVGRLAMPVPMDFALAAPDRIDAVLIYEQWGWPRRTGELQEVTARFPNALLLLDRVDSADLSPPHDATPDFEIWSLAKLLGCGGGGLLRRNGEGFVAGTEAGFANEAIATALEPAIADPVIEETLRGYRTGAPQAAQTLAAAGDLASTIAAEAADRRARLALLSDSPVGGMLSDIDAAGSATPCLVPLAVGSSDARRTALQAISTRLGIEARAYRFNTTRSDISPRFEPCVAFPIHGGVPMSLVQEFCSEAERMP